MDAAVAIEANVADGAMRFHRRRLRVPPGPVADDVSARSDGDKLAGAGVSASNAPHRALKLRRGFFSGSLPRPPVRSSSGSSSSPPVRDGPEVDREEIPQRSHVRRDVPRGCVRPVCERERRPLGHEGPGLGQRVLDERLAVVQPAEAAAHDRFAQGFAGQRAVRPPGAPTLRRIRASTTGVDLPGGELAAPRRRRGAPVRVRDVPRLTPEDVRARDDGAAVEPHRTAPRTDETRAVARGPSVALSEIFAPVLGRPTVVASCHSRGRRARARLSSRWLPTAVVPAA